MPIDPSRIEVVDDAMAEVLRQKTPEERLAIAHGMWRHARDIIRAMLRQEHSEWTEEQVQKETARRLSHGEVDVPPLSHFLAETNEGVP
jgi:hypothetical protein